MGRKQNRPTVRCQQCRRMVPTGKPTLLVHNAGQVCVDCVERHDLYDRLETPGGTAA